MPTATAPEKEPTPETKPETKPFKVRADVNLNPCPPLDANRVGQFDPEKKSTQTLVGQGKLIPWDTEKNQPLPKPKAK